MKTKLHQYCDSERGQQKNRFECLELIQSICVVCIQKMMQVLGVCVDTKDLLVCLNGSHICTKAAF